MERLDQILARWITRAEEFARFRATVDGATICGEFVAELERLANSGEEDLVSLEEAARRSGYSADHIGRLVREQKLRNYGRKGAPLVRWGDVPRKARGLTAAPALSIVSGTDRRRIARSVIHPESGGTSDAA